MVGFSKIFPFTEEQVKKIEILNQKITECETFRNAPKEKMSFKPEGDGFIMSISEDPIFPIEFAIELQKKLRTFNQYKDEEHQIKIRIGVHSGITQKVKAIVDDEYGDAFVGVTRVMSFGDTDHILLSSKTALELIQLSEKYKELLHPIGDYYDKHGFSYSLYSAYGIDFGNPNLPAKKTEEKVEANKSKYESEMKIEGKSKVHTISIAVHSDKVVYPLNSKVYVRTILNDIIHDEPILIEVYNSSNNLLVTKKIDPVTFSNKALKAHGIYQTDFLMKGTDWKVSEAYTVTAKHGQAESRDSFVIDRRAPVIQSDRSVYLLGSSLILTVVDPDANKDSQKVETAGDRPDSLVTISSSLGKITKYKLRETDTNTGIFQGLLRIVPPKHYKKGKYISASAGGKGPFDGCIPVHRGEQITFTYSTEYANALLTAYASNFGATIELDQKIYRNTDKVYITVIAPDYNLSPNKIDSIGDKIDCKITITTNLGSLSNYKLAETGIDTGIFTGVVSLKPKNQKLRKGSSIRTTKGHGPADGVILADESDEIRIILETDSYTFNAASRILSLSTSSDIKYESSPLKRVSIKDLKIINQKGENVSELKVNEQIKINATLTNNQDKEQTFAFLVQIQDQNGVTVGDILSNIGVLSSLQSFRPILYWNSPVSGIFHIQIFLWESMDKPSSLSPPSTIQIRVV